jgi:hypothetical protein
MPATTTWQEFPALWRELSEEVWACLRRAGIDHGCPNVMLYRDDVPNVEVGVEMAGSFAPLGRIIASTLPAGRFATWSERLVDGQREVSAELTL